MLGTIDKIQQKKSRPDRSYGFIAGYDGERYYFNLRGLDDLHVGDEVRFEGSFNEKGCFARHIKKII